MSTQENVQIVKDFFAAMGRGDKQGLLAISAEDIEWIIPGEWPLAGHAQQVGCLNSRRWSNAAYESALNSAFVVDRKPDGLLFGMRPRNAMPAMRFDQHIVARTHVVQRRVLFELEHGRARQQ
jgi:hypothetical protein